MFDGLWIGLGKIDLANLGFNHHKEGVKPVLTNVCIYTFYTGWWLTYPSEKYESQLGWLFSIYGKIKFMFQTTNQYIYLSKNKTMETNIQNSGRYRKAAGLKDSSYRVHLELAIFVGPTKEMPKKGTNKTKQNKELWWLNIAIENGYL